jgi:hypothetical protein
MYSGSCLCGTVRVQVTGNIENIIHCHCSLCRKSSGTAFATNGFVQTKDLAITSGDSALKAFEYKPGKRRHFCSTCGSPIYSSSDADTERVRVRIGIIDSDITERPISHNFVSSRANWEDLNAELPRHDGFEPGRQRK